MWRMQTVHERGESVFLDVAMQRVRQDEEMLAHADALIRAAAVSEPLIAEAVQTPQSPPHHAEGPFVEDHLRLMLAALFSIVEGKLHLLDIEEFRRMKGYEGEIQELEEIVKENVGLFEVFILCHDTTKFATVSFSSQPGSRGEELGFQMDRGNAWEDIGQSERAKFRERYHAMFDAFRRECVNLRPHELEGAFYEAFGIETHYVGHAKAVRSPNYSALLRRVASAHALTDRDTALVEALIFHHLEPGQDFLAANPSHMDRYLKLAAKHGFDADDFIDLLQGCVLFDDVLGRMTGDGHHRSHDPSTLMNFLRAEHDFAPWMREQKERKREAARKRVRNELFRETGLDGVALMDLLGMEPGPAFGRALAQIQDDIVLGKPFPKLSPNILSELQRRAGLFYERAFQQEL